MAELFIPGDSVGALEEAAVTLGRLDAALAGNRFLATLGDQVPAIWSQSPCRLTSWFRFTAASPKVAKNPKTMRFPPHRALVVPKQNLGHRPGGAPSARPGVSEAPDEQPQVASMTVKNRLNNFGK
jgi:hypothetical protein